MKLGKALRIGWGISLLCAVLVGSIAVFAAWEHNPQLEFHGPDRVSWLELSLIWFSWFFVVAMVLGGITSTCILVGFRIFGFCKVRGI